MVALEFCLNEARLQHVLIVNHDLLYVLMFHGSTLCSLFFVSWMKSILICDVLFSFLEEV